MLIMLIYKVLNNSIFKYQSLILLILLFLFDDVKVKKNNNLLFDSKAFSGSEKFVNLH